MTDPLEDTFPGVYADVEEVIRELFHRIPIGQEIMLSSGQRFYFKPFVPPEEGGDGRWYFCIDAKFLNPGTGRPAHFEFALLHTGGGVNAGKVLKGDVG